jgi:diguanylate cyclase (GGDEF)-like protein/PAS domain S-box-containing protein
MHGQGANRRLRFAVRLPGPSLRLLLAACCAAFLAGGALGWGSRTLALVMGDFGLGAAALLAAASCLRHAHRRRGSRARPAWFLFGLSSAMAGLGDLVWGWYEVVLGVPVPDPSPADFCFLLFAPPAIVGLLVLAKRPVTKAGWVCLGLDVWLIGGSLLTLSWSLALAHTADTEAGSVGLAALTLAYPLLDIVLVSMILALHFRFSAARSAIHTAVGALALTVLCDALFTSPLLRESYRSGHLLDAGWFAGSLLLAYAPWSNRGPGGAASERQPRAARAEDPPPTRPVAGSLAALTPYLAAAVCTLGVLSNAMAGRRIDHLVLVVGGTVVLALVVRQGIVLLDNITLTQELAQKENHFRSLVQGSSDVIMIAASTGVLRYVSPAAAGVYGTRAEALIGSELAHHIHPEDLGPVLHEIRRFLAAPPESEPTTRMECRFRHGEGHWLNVESTVSRYQGGLLFNSRDVTERVRLQAQLQHNASHDPLTDLPNRALFTERVGQVLGGRRSGDERAAVLFIDLDGFKAVNDTIGHQAGDDLLVQAGRRLQESVRAGDTAARLGGDEFAALIVGDGARPRADGAGHERRIREVADRLRAALSEPYTVDGGSLVRVGASVGVAFAEPGLPPAALMRRADLAMYRAKQTGKGRVELYAPQPAGGALRRPLTHVGRQRSGSREGEFLLLHQPVVALADGRITAVAAQPRWRSPHGILFTPAQLQRSDRAVRAHPGMLQQALQEAAARLHAGWSVPVAVRISGRSLTEHGPGVAAVTALLERHRLPAGSLVVELSDSDPRTPLDELELRLAELRRAGVLVALDGFGSGYAAIAALRRLPVDVLCLDRGLVDGVLESARLRKITAGLLRIAADLELPSVADGVDLPEQVDLLRALGCTHGMGAAFAGPLDEHRLRRALARGSLPVAERTTSAGEPAATGHPVLVTGSLPVRKGGAAGPDPVTHPPLCSHTETPVPPT